MPPQRKKKDASGALYQQVLDGMPRRIVPAPGGLDTSSAEVANVSETPEQPDSEDVPAAEGDAPPPAEEGPVHRRLIRATLPRLASQTPVRREPDFTMRSAVPTRGGKPGKNGFKSAGHRASGQGGHAEGNRPGGKRHRGHPDQQGGGWGRPGQPAHGNRAAGGPRQGRGGKKRSR